MTRTVDPRDRGRDTEHEQREFNALSTLRKRYGLTACGAGKYDARCPAHDDHSKSLRVYRGANGKLRFRCYAGCDYNAVREALGLDRHEVKSPQQSAWRPPARVAARVEVERRATNYDYAALAERFRADGRRLVPLARELGVSVESLLDAGAGFCDREPMYSHRQSREIPITAWTFPMVDDGANVTGLRLRFMNGDKGSWTDGVPGVFLGRRWGMPGAIGVCEGPTDRAALADLGYDVIGRPSCNTGDAILLPMLSRLRDLKAERPREVVIFSNLDEPKRRPVSGEVFYPGQEGAVQLADLLTRNRFTVRIVTPPSDRIKDFRKWITKGGATRGEIDAAIRAKKPHRLRR